MKKVILIISVILCLFCVSCQDTQKYVDYLDGKTFQSVDLKKIGTPEEYAFSGNTVTRYFENMMGNEFEDKAEYKIDFKDDKPVIYMDDINDKTYFVIDMEKDTLTAYNKETGKGGLVYTLK